MLLVSGTEYRGSGEWVKFQTILGGGTATLSCRDPSAPTPSTVQVLVEGWIEVHTPLLGFYSVVTTGAAKVYA